MSFACSDEIPAGGEGSGGVDAATLQRPVSDGGPLSETSGDTLSWDTQGHMVPPGTPSVLGHLAGGGTVTSPQFRLRLSVGPPAMSTPMKSPSYELLMLAPWTPDPSETP